MRDGGFNIVIVIPVFQHGKSLLNSVLSIMSSTIRIPLIVVNDGSDSMQSLLIREACSHAHIKVLERNENGGKGAAVADGLREANKQGYTHAFQIDADGQHDLSRLSEFIRIASLNHDSIILGYPCYDDSVPFGRRLGRWLTHIWVWINSMSLCIRDSMCGFRIYPIAPILEIIDGAKIGRRMDFDPELCVRACWKGLPIINLPVEVRYPSEGLSNFHMVQDNVLLARMHARLFLGMLLRSPRLLVVRMRAVMFGV